MAVDTGRNLHEGTAGVKRLSEVAASHPLGEYGAAYVEIDASELGAEPWLRLAVRANATRAWTAAALLLPPAGGGPAESVAMEIGDDGSGDLYLPDPGGHARIVLAVGSLSDGEHDLDLRDWRADAGDYTYTVEVPVAPAADSCDPAEVVLGAAGVPVVLHGSAFSGGAITVEVTGGGVIVQAATVRDDATIDLAIDVAAGAAPGPRDVVVHAGPGGSGSGCDCSAAPQGAPSSAVLLIAAVAFAWWTRRRPSAR